MVDANDFPPRGDDVPGRLGASLDRPLPSAELRQRIDRSLSDAGLIRRPSRPSRVFTWISYAAAAAILFGVGYLLGSAQTMGSASETSEPRYALLLYAPESSVRSVDDVEEHRQWAKRISREGHSISGEKLGMSAGTLGAVQESAPLEGFFIISAASDAEALAIARTSPHFKHGGRLVVRRIEPT